MHYIPLRAKAKMIFPALWALKCGSIFGRRFCTTQKHFNELTQRFSSPECHLLQHSTRTCAVSVTPFRSYCSPQHLKAERATDAHKKTPVSQRFTDPLQTINNLKQKVERISGPSSFLTYKFPAAARRGFIECEVALSWPETVRFSGKGQSKKAAKTSAAIQALEWLHTNNHIDNHCRILSFKHTAQTKNEIYLDFSESALSEIDSVLSTYSGEIMPALSSWNNGENIIGTDTHEERNLIHPTLGRPYPSPEDLNVWSETLASSFKESSRKALPIDQYRKEILDSIRTNRVMILKGETGCGKSTRIPQFILEEAISNGHGADCNIAVAQPRRLTAVETAKYVAMERGESVGKSVGYSVKMDTILPSVVGGSITFMTGLKFALKFGANPLLEGVSHVILDEVHIRDIGTDLLMHLLKQTMKINGNLRLIIMSATVNTSVFQSYFDCFGDVPVVEVPGRTFPVKMHFLDDLPPYLVPKQNTKQEVQEEDYDKENVRVEVDLHLTHNVISWINKKKPDGGILVFVSGWKEMAELQKILWEEKNLLIIPVHSMFRDCSAAFKPAPSGMRKVILATNIAETSVTFPDIVYVVDCGIHKKPQRIFLSPGGWSTSELSLNWVTKANVFQRKGRAGRVQPGESFHLFSKDVFDAMDNYELPGILCESLEYLILTVKLINPDVKAEDLVKRFPSPPRIRDVRQAVHTLQEVSLLSRESEKPTALASAVLHISSSLPSALALIYSAIFRCFDSTLLIVACEEARLQLGSREISTGSIQRSLKESYHNSSDHLAKGSILHLDHPRSKPHPSYLQAKSLKEFLRKQVLSNKAGFSGSNLNKHDNEELILGVLLHCYGSLLIRHHSLNLHYLLRERSGFPAVIKSRSVNHKSTDPFAMYLSGHMAGENCLFVSDTSIVSPLSVLLFLPTLLKTEYTNSGTAVVQVGRRSPVRIAMPQEHYKRILGLRRALTDVREYFVVAEALNQPDDNFDQICQFRTQLLECITGILKIGARSLQ